MDLLTKADAVISDCGRYRYRLSRAWGPGETCLFIMLNPSTADAFEDDPTIRRCIGFAKREGCGGLEVVNLMAWRATDPADLPLDDSAIGPDNFSTIFSAADQARGPIIAAWGAHKAASRISEQIVCGLTARGHHLHCLKLTASGAPGHPLYVKADAPLTVFARAALSKAEGGEGEG